MDISVDEIDELLAAMTGYVPARLPKHQTIYESWRNDSGA